MQGKLICMNFDVKDINCEMCRILWQLVYVLRSSNILKSLFSVDWMYCPDNSVSTSVPCYPVMLLVMWLCYFHITAYLVFHCFLSSPAC